jgi:S1-C subfamily serine protease
MKERTALLFRAASAKINSHAIPVLVAAAVGFAASHYPASVDQRKRIRDSLDHIQDSVVAIKTSSSEDGTGFFISNDGYIATASHGISNDDHYITVTTNDDKEYRAQIVYEAPEHGLDLTILHIEGVRSRPVVFANSDSIRLGDPVFEYSNQYGIGLAATVGVVSAPRRMLTMQPGAPEAPFVQFDAATNPGSSGGALFNIDGEVVGMVTNVINLSSPFVSGQNSGVSVAVPANKIIARLQTMDLRERFYSRPVWVASFRNTCDSVP